MRRVDGGVARSLGLLGPGEQPGVLASKPESASSNLHPALPKHASPRGSKKGTLVSPPTPTTEVLARERGRTLPSHSPCTPAAQRSGRSPPVTPVTADLFGGGSSDDKDASMERPSRGATRLSHRRRSKSPLFVQDEKQRRAPPRPGSTAAHHASSDGLPPVESLKKQRGSWSGSITDEEIFRQHESDYNDSDFASVLASSDEEFAAPGDGRRHDHISSWPEGPANNASSPSLPSSPLSRVDDVDDWLRRNLPPPAPQLVQKAFEDSITLRESQMSSSHLTPTFSFPANSLGSSSGSAARNRTEKLLSCSSESQYYDSDGEKPTFAPKINARSRILAARSTLRAIGPVGHALYEQSKGLEERKQAQKQQVMDEISKRAEGSFMSENSIRLLSRKLRIIVEKTFFAYDIHGIGAIQASGLERVLMCVGVLGDRTPSDAWGYLIKAVWERLSEEVHAPSLDGIASPYRMLAIRLRPLSQLLVDALVDWRRARLALQSSNSAEDLSLLNSLRQAYTRNGAALELLTAAREIYSQIGCKGAKSGSIAVTDDAARVDAKKRKTRKDENLRRLSSRQIHAMWKRVQEDIEQRSKRRERLLQERETHFRSQHSFTPVTNFTSVELVSRRASRIDATQVSRVKALARERLRGAGMIQAAKTKRAASPLSTEEMELRNHCSFAPKIVGFSRGDPPNGKTADETRARRETWIGTLARRKQARLRRLSMIKLKHRLSLRSDPIPQGIRELFEAEGVPVPDWGPSPPGISLRPGKRNAEAASAARSQRKHLITDGCQRAMAKFALRAAEKQGGSAATLVFIIQYFDTQGRPKSHPVAVSCARDIRKVVVALMSGMSLELRGAGSMLEATMRRELKMVLGSQENDKAETKRTYGMAIPPIVTLRVSASSRISDSVYPAQPEID